MEEGTTGFVERLKSLIGDESVSRFAQDVGLGDNLIRQYLRGGMPGLDKVVRICEAKGVSIRWLALGLGEKFSNEGDASPGEVAARSVASARVRAYLVGEGRPQGDFVYLPKYSVKAHAGGGFAVESEQIVNYFAFQTAWFEKNVGIAPTCAALIEVRGDSMTPVLLDGELVIVDTSCDAFKDDAIYVLQYSGALRIKNVRRRLDGKIEIKSANEGYGLELLTEQEAEAGTITIVGRARWALSGRRLP